MMTYMITNEVIFMMMLCYVMCLSSKNETTGAGVKKMEFSANPDNFITKMLLTIQ